MYSMQVNFFLLIIFSRLILKTLPSTITLGLGLLTGDMGKAVISLFTATAETDRLSPGCPGSQAGSCRKFPPPQWRLSRPPLRELSVLSPSPEVDILKTQRVPPASTPLIERC